MLLTVLGTLIDRAVLDTEDLLRLRTVADDGGRRVVGLLSATFLTLWDALERRGDSVEVVGEVCRNVNDVIKGGSIGGKVVWYGKDKGRSQQGEERGRRKRRSLPCKQNGPADVRKRCPPASSIYKSEGQDG
jgi:hypothetical protein